MADTSPHARHGHAAHHAADAAGAEHPAPARADALTFWEGRYSESNRIWSGRVNTALARVAGGLLPGRALDLGCGEGGDSVWLAEQGWRVTGVDLSTIALGRAAAAAADRGLGDLIDFRQVDLVDWTTAERFDLVSGCFLQSPVDFPRSEIVRRAADLVAPGGRLLLVSHAAPPPWSRLSTYDAGLFPSPASELRDLAPDSGWVAEIADVRGRAATGPDGAHATLDDTVVLLLRTDHP